jgi:hypothetical protein
MALRLHRRINGVVSINAAPGQVRSQQSFSKLLSDAEQARAMQSSECSRYSA